MFARDSAGRACSRWVFPGLLGHLQDSSSLLGRCAEISPISESSGPKVLKLVVNASGEA